MCLLIAAVSFWGKKKQKKGNKQRRGKREPSESNRDEDKQRDEGLWRVNREMADESLKMLRDFLEVIGCLCGLRFL